MGRPVIVVRDLVLFIVTAAGLLSCVDPPAIGPGTMEIVDPVVSDARVDAQFAIGRDDKGVLCAEAGSARETLRVCGGHDLAALAFQTEEAYVLAGYVPMPVGSLTAILDGKHRRPLQLTPIPDAGMLAFGLIERASPAIIEIQVVDENGEIIKRYFPTIGPVQ